MLNPIPDVQAIDVHAHYGLYPVDQPLCNTVRAQCMTGDAAEVVRRARAVNVQTTVVSPLSGLMPRGRADAAAGNDEARQIVPKTPGLKAWVIVDPHNPRTFDQARELLSPGSDAANPGRFCVGIKIHPEEHVYPICRFGDAIFKLAAELKAVVLTHSGEFNSMPADFLPFADAYPEVKLILAHIGCGYDGVVTHQISAAARSKHGNIYADTSSATSILPGLIELAVREIGAQRVLFGTDTPLYSTAMQRARIDHADLTEPQKRMILRDNAAALLGLS